MPLSMTRFIALLALPLAVSPSPLVGRMATLRPRRRRVARLDLEQAPERLLRDLGILDGRGDTHPREGHRRGK